jgi:hypothetical protein
LAKNNIQWVQKCLALGVGNNLAKKNVWLSINSFWIFLGFSTFLAINKNIDT